jgi:hypothetical protein
VSQGVGRLTNATMESVPIVPNAVKNDSAAKFETPHRDVVGGSGLRVVLTACEISRKIAKEGWVKLVIAGGVIAVIYLLHSSLTRVTWIQVLLIVALLFTAAIPFLVSLLFGEDDNRPVAPGSVRFCGQVSENEVIAEFLKNDFQFPQFAQHHELVARLVAAPNLQDQEQNEIRRALFNARHESLWRELPKDTDWFEAEIQASDLLRLQVFPRAQWLKLAPGDFGLMRVAQRIRDNRYRNRLAEAFRQKIDHLRHRLEQDDLAGTILLIGRSERGPFTILDGNHRLVAAILISPQTLNKFRFICGLSSKMDQCCWYQTNITTLLRHGANLLRHFIDINFKRKRYAFHGPGVLDRWQG